MADVSARRKLELADRALIQELERRMRCRRSFSQYRNATLAKYRPKISSVEGLDRVWAFLEEKGAFSIKLERRRFRDTDGQDLKLTLARATSTDMWPMGTNYWVRDNALAGARYLFSPKKRFRKRGKELLLSALTFMSSRSQLERCEKMIRSRSASFARDAGNWPYIFANISSNLSTHNAEPWAHKQDAWQIVVFYVVEAIEQGLISPRELTKKHKTFISLIVPFMAKVSFWKCENSGSWEEVPAVRTSVRAWEHRLLIKLLKLAQVKGFEGLGTSFKKHRSYLQKNFRSLTLEQAVLSMEREVIREMTSDLPGESPRYRRSDARYRGADAALIYLLMIDYPYFLAARSGKDPEWAHRLEARVFKTIMSLEDKITGGILRYKNDCYQRTGYFRNVTIQKLTEVSGAPSGDASGHFLARNRVVPKGREAAWTHFVWQLAAWAGRRYLETGSKVYRRIHNTYFERGMALFTGQGEVSVDQDSHGKPRVIKIPPLRMPECYISDVTASGKALVFPSPHTPLNWAVAEMFDAFGVRGEILKAGE